MTAAIETFIPRNIQNYLQRVLNWSFQHDFVVKTATSPAIYLVSNGTKRHIPNQGVMKTLGYRAGAVARAEQDFIDSIPSGPDMGSV